MGAVTVCVPAAAVVVAGALPVGWEVVVVLESGGLVLVPVSVGWPPPDVVAVALVSVLVASVVVVSLELCPAAEVGSVVVVSPPVLVCEPGSVVVVAPSVLVCELGSVVVVAASVLV
ncbi:MAG: hypothetical protein ABSC51_08760 [Gaiellaceae bacterium]